jgi:putative transposase
MDAQSVKTVEESGRIRGGFCPQVCQRPQTPSVSGYTGFASVFLCHACQRARYLGRFLLAGLKYIVRRFTKIWADQAYQGQELYNWCKATGSWELEVVKRPTGVHEWSRQPCRWIVERALSSLSRNRRMSKDYDRKVQTSETFIAGAMIRLLEARLAPRS